MNETGFAPPPVLPPVLPKHDHSIKLLIVATLGVVAAFVIFFIVISLHRQHPTPPAAMEFPLHFGVSTSWYGLAGTDITPLAKQSSAAGIPLAVIELGAPLSAHASPALVRVPGKPGVAFGIVSGDGSFRPVDASDSFKEGLVVRDGTFVAYSAFVPTHASTTGPASLSIQGTATATSTGAWHLKLVDTASSTASVRDLGKGFGPRFLPDGNILALGPEGVVEIASTTGKRTTLIPGPGLIAGAYDASPDASLVAITAANQVDIYALGGGAHLLGSVPPVSPLAFVNDRELATFDLASSTAEIYEIAGATITHLMTAPVVGTPTP